MQNAVQKKKAKKQHNVSRSLYSSLYSIKNCIFTWKRF